MSMNIMLNKYFNSFFKNTEEKIDFLAKCPTSDFNNTEDMNKWIKLENKFKHLLCYNELSDFKLTVNKNGTTILNDIFSRYITSNTFVVATVNHEIILEYTNNIPNCYYITAEDINCPNIEKIITQYKASNCDNIFIYLNSIVDGKLLYNDFVSQLINNLQIENINYSSVYDAVSSLFIVPENYELFDYIVFSGHSIIPYYNLGLLFSKKNTNFGYSDLTKTTQYYELLVKFLNNRDKIYMFNYFMEQYFKDFVFDNKLKFISNSCLGIVYIKIVDPLYKKIISKQIENLNCYGIYFDETFVQIRLTFLLSEDTTKIINSLNKLKDVMKKYKNRNLL